MNRTEALPDGLADYALDDQVGFRLRLAMQRHTAIFFTHMDTSLTQTQFAVVARLWEHGPCSQNELGRLAGIDTGTIGGVVQRLRANGFVVTDRHPSDRRRVMVELSADGRLAADEAIRKALRSNEKTLEPLSPDECRTLIRLLRKISE